MKKLSLLFVFLCLGIVSVNARSIQGTCVDEQGNPLADVRVSVTLRALVGDGPEAVYTDAEGKYVIELPDGYFGDMVYWIIASKNTDDGAYGIVKSFIPLSDDVTEINLELMFDEVLTFDTFDYRNEYLVLDIETGEPIEGATVQEFYRHYEHDNGIQKGEKFVTDEVGCITTDNRISETFCWHPSYVMAKAQDYGTEKVFCNFTGGGGLSSGLEQVIIYMKRGKVSEDGGFPDGIEQVNLNVPTSKHYSVSGVEIAPTTKGIHIVNGKKMIVK